MGDAVWKLGWVSVSVDVVCRLYIQYPPQNNAMLQLPCKFGIIALSIY